MAIRFGHVAVFRSITPKVCAFCKKDIESRRWYVKTVGSTKTKRFSHHYHMECFPQYMLDRTKERIANPRTSAHINQHAINTLSPEQIKRRETLQRYLSGKDLVRLYKAYESGNTSRVFVSYRIIATRWAELHQMGIPFRTTFLPVRTVRTVNDKRLSDIIKEYDWRWQDRFDEQETVEGKIRMLIRPINESDKVYW